MSTTPGADDYERIPDNAYVSDTANVVYVVDEPATKGNSHDTTKTDKPAFTLLSLEEFVQRPTISSHPVRGVVPPKAIIVGFGPPKGGKTFSICDLTMHAAHGLDWHGCSIPRRVRVIYLCGEGVTGFKVRLRAWLEHHDHIDEPGEFYILPHALSLPACAAALVETLRSLKPDIVVTDTLNAYFGGGDENATKDMSSFCDAIRCLRDELGCSVVVIHHTGHRDAGRERGSIVLRATADVVIQIGKDESAGQLVGFQVIAARDMEPMGNPISLRLVRHETDWHDEDGQPLVSCVVQAGGQPVTLPGRRGGKPLGDAQAAVLKAAQDIGKGTKPDASGEVLLARADIATLAKQRGVSKQSVSSAWGPLASRGYFRMIEPGSIAMRVRTE